MPATEFLAYVVDGANSRGLRTLTHEDLPEDGALIRVEWAGINFKDALVAAAVPGVARSFPIVPGIDLAGAVVTSDDPRVPTGAKVVGHGGDLGVSRHGAYAVYARVPHELVTVLPSDMTTREAAALGTAAITALLMVNRLHGSGVAPDSGPVVVTGASGGVGLFATEMLAARGYTVWAQSSRDEVREPVLAVGATSIIPSVAVQPGHGEPLPRWAGALDVVGEKTLPALLEGMDYRGVVVATGNTSGNGLVVNLSPVQDRAVQLEGVQSTNLTEDERDSLWAVLAGRDKPTKSLQLVDDISIDELDSALNEVLAGRAPGKRVVRIAPPEYHPRLH
jgi:putative YhdH/YhfP family quinone oxidoreductase